MPEAAAKAEVKDTTETTKVKPTSIYEFFEDDAMI
jgi:hypothetical protein